jgi:hypothetical protein
MPLGHLIALISNAHPVLAGFPRLDDETRYPADTRLDEHAQKDQNSSG